MQLQWNDNYRQYSCFTRAHCPHSPNESNRPTTTASSKPLSQHQEVNTNKEEEAQNQVMKYASYVISHELLARDLHDAWKQGGGGRHVRCWTSSCSISRGQLYICSQSLKLIAQVHVLGLLIPWKAHQLTWESTNI